MRLSSENFFFAVNSITMVEDESCYAVEKQGLKKLYFPQCCYLYLLFKKRKKTINKHQ